MLIVKLNGLHGYHGDTDCKVASISVEIHTQLPSVGLHPELDFFTVTHSADWLSCLHYL